MTVETLTAIINRLLPEPHAGLLSGILFGTRASLDPHLYQSLINSGTLHITALSGANITILMNLAIPPLLRVFSRRIASLLTCGIIIGFIFFVGPSPSIVRAGLMGALSLVATTLGKQTWALWFWCITAVAMILFSPPIVTNVSFQLSTLATLGIILFAGKRSTINHWMINTNRTNRRKILSKTDMTNRMHVMKTENEIQHTTMITREDIPLSRPSLWIQQAWVAPSLFWKLIFEDIRLTLAAQVFTLPIMIFTFHQISIIVPVSNLLIAWLLPPLTVIGFCICTIGLTWLPLAVIPSWIAWLMLEYMLVVIDMTGKIPLGSVSW